MTGGILSADSNAIHLAGNTLDNRLEGNAQNNVITGGLGQDVLIGGAGMDQFVFNTALPNNVDTIVDFAQGESLLLDDAVFLSLSGKVNQALPADWFALNAAKDGNDFIVYQQATGRVFYDADGSGAGAAVCFADLHDGFALGAGQIRIV